MVQGKHTYWMGALATAAAVVMLASCGGGGGGGSSSGSGSAGGTGTTSSGSSGSSSTVTPTLAAATPVLDGTALGASQWPSGSTSSGGTGQPVSGLSCTDVGNTYTYSHLSIYQNGKQLALPTNIGTVAPTMAMQRGCVYPVHTVDSTGKIRIDATNNTPYTLGQFFAVWGEPLSTTNVAGISGPVTAW